jgi:hypothetical protein
MSKKIIALKISSFEEYILNFEISAALWVHIAAFEVTLRSFLHNSLRKIYRSKTWWDFDNLLAPNERGRIEKVMKRLKIRKLASSPKTVIENLSFSFWVELLGKRYHETIWLKIIGYFPVYPGRREDFYNKAREIRNLRNSIAHHGPIMRRDLIRDHAYLGELTAILDPELAREVEKRSRVLDLLLNARLVGSGGGI